MKTIQLFIVCAFFFGNSFAQQPPQAVPKFPNTLEGQFKKIYKKSNNYQIYKVIKKGDFLKLQRNVLDSIFTIKKDIVAKQQTINSQQENITSLESKITTLNENLTASMDKEGNISLFGIQLNKAAYNIILWGIIAALLAGLLLFMYRYNGSNSVTLKIKNALENVEQDFEQHRKKTIENEQKLRRQLQDEINKKRGI